MIDFLELNFFSIISYCFLSLCSTKCNCISNYFQISPRSLYIFRSKTLSFYPITVTVFLLSKIFQRCHILNIELVQNGDARNNGHERYSEIAHCTLSHYTFHNTTTFSNCCNCKSPRGGVNR